MINRLNLQRESNLAQFREDEAKRIEAERIVLFQQDKTLSQQDENKSIRLSQQLAQAQADEETALETKRLVNLNTTSFLHGKSEKRCLVIPLLARRLTQLLIIPLLEKRLAQLLVHTEMLLLLNQLSLLLNRRHTIFFCQRFNSSMSY